ncbi:hypothetical protein LMH73_003690 [Vibrio splendidus]|nr:hypothetical protein [Vibrio splendidus]MCC4882968.1 hypothetical protein [Vibrio splendidus]
MEQDFDAIYTGKSQTVVAPTFSPSEIIRKKKEQRESETNSQSTDVTKQRKSLEIRKKSARIRNFTNTISEISPLIDVSAKHCSNKDDFSKSLLAYYSLQERVKSHVFDKMNITAYSPEIRSSGYNLGYNISEMIANGSINGFDEDKIDAIVDIITELNSTSTIVRDLYEKNVVTSDTLVNIKCAIFPYAIFIEGVLNQMGYVSDKKLIHVKWFHTMSLSLAKDIAFNWDKYSGFREREVLFENMLKYCCEITIDTWVDHVIESLDSDFIHFTQSQIMDYLPKFKAAISKCSMGYESHPEYTIKWLHDEFSVYIFSLLEDRRIKSFNNKQNGIYYGRLLKLIDDTLATSWENWSQEMIEMIKNMTSSERAEWAKSDGARPMNTIGVKEDLISFIDEDIQNQINISADYSVLEQKAKARLAILWGMSNAICKKKSS